MERDAPDETCIEQAPLGDGRLSTSHIAEALVFRQGPGTKARDGRGLALQESPRLADQVRQAGLPEPYPFAGDAIVIAHEDTLQSLMRASKASSGTMGMDHEQRHPGSGHDPEPLEDSLSDVGCFVHMPDFAFAGNLSDALIVRLDGRRDTVDDLLDGPKADGNAQHGGVEVLEMVRLSTCPPAI